jgi:hypothetical protein
MTHRKNIILFFTGAATAVAALFLLFTRLHQSTLQSYVPSSEGRNSRQAASPVPALEDRQSGRAGERKIQGSTSDVAAEVRQLAQSGNPDRWKAIEKKYLNQLTPAELWDVLNAPGVAEESESKQLQNSIANVCGIRAQFDEAGQPRPRLYANNAVVDDYCNEMKSVGDSQSFFQKMQAFQQDAGFLSDANNVSLSTKGMDTLSLADMGQALRDQLFGSQDPWQMQHSIHDLVSYDPGLISPDPNAISALSASERSNLYTALSYAVPCASIGGCSALNPLTVEYCARVGNICASGMSINSAIQNNLPPGEIPLFNLTLAYILGQISQG